MSLTDFIRLMFAITFVVLASAAMGAVIEGTSNLGYEAGLVVLIAVGIGAGLWALSEWRREPKSPPTEKGVQDGRTAEAEAAQGTGGAGGTADDEREETTRS